MGTKGVNTSLNDNGLNTQQQLFIDEYLVDFNGKQAAIRAGYSERSAESTSSRLLSLDKFKLAIQKGQEITKTKLNITKEDLLKDLQEIKDAQKSSNSSAAIKAIEVMSKMLGFYVPEKVEHTGNQAITVIKITEVRKDN